MKQAHGEWEKMKNANNSSLQPAGGQGMQRQHSSGGQVNGQQQQQSQQQQGGEVNMSPQQPQGAFQQPQAQTSQPPVAPSPVQPQQPQQNMAQQPNTAQNYSQQMNMAQQQASQQQGQPQRPQMNAQQMAQAQAAQNMQQQQQQQHAQNSAVPQSATQQQVPQQNQQQQQRPQPLTHQAAVNQAAQSYSREQQAAQQQGSQQNVPQLPNGQMSLNGVPQSATQTTPSSAYPALQQQTHGGPSTTKFPIPKQLTLDPRTQAPVPGPPSRPTYQSSGMMQQPGVQRPAQFTLEGEGDRVLSKRKLDELVRQVTGTPATDPSSDSHALAPDVEEAVLTLADDFVDNVITAACRLAKLRSSQTLDIRDVQIVLERNYGIRIPGYSLDEVRTVRKFQPAPGWTSKMQAVHSAKVMGNGGRDS
jgi:transcription initiation factor TFIID subunit TAF12